MLDGLQMTLIDIIILIIVILSGGLAAVRGFVREFLSILSWAGAALIAVYGYPYAQPYAASLTDIKLFADAGTAIVLFIVSLAILSIISNILSSGVKDSAVGPLDRALGFLFGIGRGIFLVCLIFIGASFVWEEENMPNMVKSSKSFPIIKVTSAKLLDILPTEYGDSSNIFINDAKKKINDVNKFKQQYEKLSNPKPEPVKNKVEQSYGEFERLQLENLIDDSR